MSNGKAPQPASGDKSAMSSLERAAASRLISSVVRLLRQGKVTRILAIMRKGQITINVRDGVAIEVVPSPALRVGYELPKEERNEE